MADYARGERLRELRAAKHASQEAVAFALGVSTKTVRAWEHGGGIHWDNAKKLAAFYGADPETLVSREVPEGESTDAVPTLPQLDRIEANTEQILRLLNALAVEEAAALVADAAPLSEAIASRATKAPGRSQTPPANRQRKRAS